MTIKITLCKPFLFKTNPRKQYIVNMKINYKITIILLFVICVGISCGAFFEVAMEGENKEYIQDTIANLFKSEEEMGSIVPIIKNCVITAILGYISPLLFILLPVIPLYILLKGISIGFSATLMLELFGMKGILYILATLLPQNIILIPVLCILGSLSFQMGLTVIKLIRERKSTGQNRNKRALQKDAKLYSLLYLAGVILMIISCLLGNFLLQVVVLPS